MTRPASSQRSFVRSFSQTLDSSISYFWSVTTFKRADEERNRAKRRDGDEPDSIVAFLLEVCFYHYYDVVQRRDAICYVEQWRDRARVPLEIWRFDTRVGSRGSYERLDAYPPNLQIHRILSPWNKLENLLRDRCERRYPYQGQRKEKLAQWRAELNTR